mmetsp:Transcript_76733/g.140453  ORF Transcript_76733/g.140453 Transcript_76733/m.140453 type:complete len:430 (+) Transcript_76733:3-1292(+)
MPARHHTGADDGVGVPEESMGPKPRTMRSLFLKRGRTNKAQPKEQTRGRSPGPGAKIVTPTPSLELAGAENLPRKTDSKVVTPRGKDHQPPMMNDNPFGAADGWVTVPEPIDSSSRVHFGHDEQIAISARGRHEPTHHAATGVLATSANQAPHDGALRAGGPLGNDGWETVPDAIMPSGSKAGPMRNTGGRAPPAPPMHTMGPQNFRNGLRSPGFGAGGQSALPMHPRGMPHSPQGFQAHGVPHGARGLPGHDLEAVPTDTGAQGHMHHVSPARGIGPPGMNMNRAWDQDSDRADAGSYRHVERSQNLGRLHADSQPHMHPASGLAQRQRAWDEDSTGARASNQEEPMSMSRQTSPISFHDWDGHASEATSEEMKVAGEDAGVPVRGYVMDRSSTAQRDFGGGAAAARPGKAPEAGDRSHPDWRLDFFD